MNLKVQNALISVSNKENLISLLKTLKKYNVNIISSGGTYRSIKKMGFTFDVLKINYLFIMNTGSASKKSFPLNE